MSDTHRNAPDEELLRRVREDPDGAAGRAAIEALLGRYMERIYLYCFRMVRDRDRALDLAQEAMIDALRGLPGFEGRARFASWLFAIVRNRCRTALRPRSLTRDDEVETDELSDGGANPEALWIEREGEARLERLVMEHLEPLEQNAIWLRCVEGMPVDEITRVLGVESASGARGLLQTARRKLRAALSREEQTGKGEPDGTR
ncbi:MAG TPA: sigma-70 family RNA polymerase sigma factor [Candidatus Sulfotelmatobacter sp.]|nr:sigma-70 family RNA polymerase sigma factor [Candidatus Sulfotelmatobacter sp.]